MTKTNLFQIARRFILKGEVRKVFPFGSGHINDSFKVETTGPDYLLQRVNQEVFKNIAGLMENILAVTEFLSKRLESSTHRMVSLRLVAAKSGGFIFRDASGQIWRMFHFVQDSKSYDRVQGPDMAMEGGRAYGWFIRRLEGFPAAGLVETIPRFHSAAFRIEQFRKAIDEDLAGRLDENRTFVNGLAEMAGEMFHIYLLGKEGKIPVRVTHNDTKINNILFDENGNAICIIDLDTVMPGYIHFDFGDAIRTFANTADEDEKDLDRTFFSIELFEAFTRGFLLETQDILTATERQSLVYGPPYIVYEQAIRFLTDYLNGDQYYKVHSPDHNLVRARAQEKLLSEMMSAFPGMKKIITDLL